MYSTSSNNSEKEHDICIPFQMLDHRSNPMQGLDGSYDRRGQRTFSERYKIVQPNFKTYHPYNTSFRKNSRDFGYTTESNSENSENISPNIGYHVISQCPKPHSDAFSAQHPSLRYTNQVCKSAFVENADFVTDTSGHSNYCHFPSGGKNQDRFLPNQDLLHHSNHEKYHVGEMGNNVTTQYSLQPSTSAKNTTKDIFPIKSYFTAGFSTSVEDQASESDSALSILTSQLSEYSNEFVRSTENLQSYTSANTNQAELSRNLLTSGSIKDLAKHPSIHKEIMTTQEFYPSRSYSMDRHESNSAALTKEYVSYERKYRYNAKSSTTNATCVSYEVQYNRNESSEWSPAFSTDTVPKKKNEGKTQYTNKCPTIGIAQAFKPHNSEKCSTFHSNETNRAFKANVKPSPKESSGPKNWKDVDYKIFEKVSLKDDPKEDAQKPAEIKSTLSPMRCNNSNPNQLPPDVGGYHRKYRVVRNDKYHKYNK